MCLSCFGIDYNMAMYCIARESHRIIYIYTYISILDGNCILLGQGFGEGGGGEESMLPVIP